MLGIKKLKINETLLVCITVTVIAFLAFIIYSHYLPTVSSNSGLCKDGIYTKPLVNEIEYNNKISKEKSVQYLRRSINDFLSSQYLDVSACKGYPGLYLGNHCADSVYSPDYGDVMSLANKGFLESKFIVLSTDMAPGGGESVILMFKDKPDQLFYAWVFSDDDYYDLRGFSEYTPTGEEMGVKDVQKVYINQLCSDEMGI